MRGFPGDAGPDGAPGPCPTLVADDACGSLGGVSLECEGAFLADVCNGETGDCSSCPPGPAGPAGPQGPAGIPGPQAIIVLGVTNFTMYFALMPGDNSATVGGGDFVEFPQDYPRNQGGYSRADVGNFILQRAGVYEVSFQVSVDEAGQLEVWTGAALGTQTAVDHTVVGRLTLTSQIVGHTLIRTPAPNYYLSIRNPLGNTPALTITPTAGSGTATAVSANLLLRRLA